MHWRRRAGLKKESGTSKKQCDCNRIIQKHTTIWVSLWPAKGNWPKPSGNSTKHFVTNPTMETPGVTVKSCFWNLKGKGGRNGSRRGVQRNYTRTLADHSFQPLGLSADLNTPAIRCSNPGTPLSSGTRAG